MLNHTRAHKRCVHGQGHVQRAPWLIGITLPPFDSKCSVFSLLTIQTCLEYLVIAAKESSAPVVTSTGALHQNNQRLLLKRTSSMSKTCFQSLPKQERNNRLIGTSTFNDQSLDYRILNIITDHASSWEGPYRLEQSASTLVHKGHNVHLLLLGSALGGEARVCTVCPLLNLGDGVLLPRFGVNERVPVRAHNQTISQTGRSSMQDCEVSARCSSPLHDASGPLTQTCLYWLVARW